MLYARPVIPILHRAERCRWCGESFDHRIHARRGRLRARCISGLPRLTEFAIAIGLAMNAALQAVLGQLFLDLSAALGAVGPHIRSRVLLVSRTSSNF